MSCGLLGCGSELLLLFAPFRGTDGPAYDLSTMERQSTRGTSPFLPAIGWTRLTVVTTYPPSETAILPFVRGSSKTKCDESFAEYLTAKRLLDSQVTPLLVQGMTRLITIGSWPFTSPGRKVIGMAPQLPAWINQRLAECPLTHFTVVSRHTGIHQL